jgi:hypothetical protein
MTTVGKRRPLPGLGRLARESLVEIGEAVRLAEFALLDVSARLLPRALALAIADFMGLLFAVSPLGLRLYHRMRQAFPRDADSWRTTRKYLALPLRDHVVMLRIATGREDPTMREIVSRNAPAILQQPEQSFILATGHFAREAVITVFTPHATGHELMAVMAPVERTLSPKALRLRVQLSRMRESVMRVRKGAAEIVDAGAPGGAGRVLRHLRKPGSLVFNSPDVPWTHAPRSDRFERPFAGRAMQSFATGTARLSRLSRRPIVTCVPFLDDAGRVVLDWGEPIAPPPKDDLDADARVTSLILDRLEVAVGLRPAQYVIPIGHERCWDPDRKCWMNRGESRVASQRAVPGPGLRRASPPVGGTQATVSNAASARERP